MKETIFVYIYGYLPGIQYGGPVTSIYNFTEHFGDKYDIRIVCSNHEHGEKTPYSNISKGWNRVGKAHVIYLPESQYTINTFKKLMESYYVKMAYLTGVFSYRLNHAAISACKDQKIKVVIATRGEICKNILSMKSYKKLPYLQVMKWLKEFNDVYFQVTSIEERLQLIKYLNIADDRIKMLPNIHGKEMNIERPIKVTGEAKFLFISRIHPKKNLIDAINAVISAKGRIIFDIYGPIEDVSYWEKCQEIISKSPQNVVINYCGNLDMNQARESYYRYHGLLFPTLSENYGHVIVESMIAKCPVIISKGTTPWDDADNLAGYVVELHNIKALTEAIEKIVNMSQEEFSCMQKKLDKYRNDKLQLSELISGYEKLIND